MKLKHVFLVIAILAAAGATLWLAPWTGLRANANGSGVKDEHNGRKVLYWVDPMHPQYKSDKPGKAPDCGMDMVPVYADEQASRMPEGTVEISTAKQQLIGVTLGEASYGPVRQTMRTVGKLTYDETKIARVHPKIEGWIERVFVDFTGKQVRKGEPLISVYSPELLSSQQELLIARRARDELGGNSSHEIASNALSLYRATKERLRLWDISEEDIRQVEESGKPIKALTLFSPLDGFVLTRNAFERQRVTPETELYTIADLSIVWVLAEVYEYEIPLIKVGQSANVTLSYLPGWRFRGKVAYIYPQLDPTTRTLKVRLEVPNPRHELKPDMFANVEFHIDYGRQISVPEEAVLDSGQEQTVFVAHEGGYFEPRKVQLGPKVERRYVVLNGLKPGEKIVTSGNFLVDSESRLKSAMGAMGEHSGMAMPQAKPKEERQQPPPKINRRQDAPNPAIDHSTHGAGVDHGAHGAAK